MVGNGSTVVGSSLGRGDLVESLVVIGLGHGGVGSSESLGLAQGPALFISLGDGLVAGLAGIVPVGGAEGGDRGGRGARQESSTDKSLHGGGGGMVCDPPPPVRQERLEGNRSQQLEGS